jgi:GNAT superfamily N-acetyltransferase
MIVYRPMQLHDITDGLSLCRSAGWNQLARYWEKFLQLSPNGCFVATNEKKVVGTAAAIRYQHFFSWIGMVLVDPAYQRQGIGKQLLKEALQILQDEETIKLDATPAGREVYLKLNFVDEYPLSRMVLNSSEEKPEVTAALPLQKNDLNGLAEFDRKIFGADRQALLKLMFEGNPQYAFIVKKENELQGYCMGRQGHNFTHIGPVVAKNFAIAKDLVTAALNNNLNHSIILDILHFDPEWMNWLTSIGFTEQRPLIRMYRGSNRFPGVPEKQFAILGPEFG